MGTVESTMQPQNRRRTTTTTQFDFPVSNDLHSDHHNITESIRKTLGDVDSSASSSSTSIPPPMSTTAPTVSTPLLSASYSVQSSNRSWPTNRGSTTTLVSPRTLKSENKDTANTTASNSNVWDLNKLGIGTRSIRNNSRSDAGDNDETRWSQQTSFDFAVNSFDDWLENLEFIDEKGSTFIRHHLIPADTIEHIVLLYDCDVS
jgi:hypothetical protein